jgi:hypothetical protein
MKHVMIKWREWNERACARTYYDLFCHIDTDALNAFKKHPYSWMWLLIPIVGLLAFEGIVQEARMARRWEELYQRKKQLTNLSARF